jgi:hypothetical protein
VSRVAALAAAMLVLAAALTGCGGVSAADLFLVTRTGPTPGQRLVLLVNEEGGVTCNGRPVRKLDDAQIVKAREIQEDLHTPAGENLHLPARPGSVFSYSVRDENGTVNFADNSAGQPHVFRDLALFVLQTAQQVCHLPE